MTPNLVTQVGLLDYVACSAALLLFVSWVCGTFD